MSQRSKERLKPNLSLNCTFTEIEHLGFLSHISYMDITVARDLCVYDITVIISYPLNIHYTFM